MATKKKKFPKARKTKAKLYDQDINVKAYLNKSGHHSQASVEIRLPKARRGSERFPSAFITISDCDRNCQLVLSAYGGTTAGITGSENAMFKIDTLYKAVKKMRNEMLRRTGKLKRPGSHLQEKKPKKKAKQTAS